MDQDDHKEKRAGRSGKNLAETLALDFKRGAAAFRDDIARLFARQKKPAEPSPYPEDAKYDAPPDSARDRRLLWGRFFLAAGRITCVSRNQRPLVCGFCAARTAHPRDRRPLERQPPICNHRS